MDKSCLIMLTRMQGKFYNLSFPEANSTIQKLTTESASGVSAAVGAAEAESRHLREELAILHKVVAGK